MSDDGALRLGGREFLFTRTDTQIYVCVCVCACAYVFFPQALEARQRERKKIAEREAIRVLCARPGA